jgi:hypothetical protein
MLQKTIQILAPIRGLRRSSSEAAPGPERTTARLQQNPWSSGGRLPPVPFRTPHELLLQARSGPSGHLRERRNWLPSTHSYLIFTLYAIFSLIRPITSATTVARVSKEPPFCVPTVQFSTRRNSLATGGTT